jgi:hypothetical protein
MKNEPIPMTRLFRIPRTIALLTTVVAFTATLPRARSADEPFSSVHGLIQLEFSDHYITPRGLDVENQGVIFQPLMLLFWDLYSAKDGGIDDISLTTGVWNSWHTNKSGASPGHWNEIDPILGLTFKFQKDWQFDVGYSAFHSEVGSYPTSNNLDLKLTYHDAGAGGVTFNPYIEYFDELHQKATVDLNPPTSKTGYYFVLGCDPTYKIDNIKLELPTFLNFVSSNFYQKFNGAGGGAGLAVFSTEIKGTIPLTVPQRFGFWSYYTGVQYYHLSNDGLLDGNQVLAVSKRTPNLFQFHTGITIFF